MKKQTLLGVMNPDYQLYYHTIQEWETREGHYCLEIRCMIGFWKNGANILF